MYDTSEDYQMLDGFWCMSGEEIFGDPFLQKNQVYVRTVRQYKRRE